MTKLLTFETALVGKRILVTGHTGFTGSWACLWLNTLSGTELAGFSLPPDTSPSLFEALQIENDVTTTFGDICEYERLHDAIDDFQPELILHLAAQPLVRRSYRQTLTTFTTNALGTAHVLEAARRVKSVRGVLCITTDKVYKNNEWPWPYRENDELGGKDPYSASKAAAEIIIQSYMTSFPWPDQGPAIATARGGNIVGGGDWSEDRLIPDFVRAVTNHSTLTLRYPGATRPWQHVLGLVQGYLMLMAGLVSPDPEPYSKAWNFGPAGSRHYTVKEVLELMCDIWKRPELQLLDNPLPEAGNLGLDSTLARNSLGWKPVWDTETVIAETAGWYREYYKNPVSARQLSMEQLTRWREGIRE